jgi:hypothetical protein
VTGLDNGKGMMVALAVSEVPVVMIGLAAAMGGGRLAE